MYGTVARMKIQREKVDELLTLLRSLEPREVEGYRSTNVLIPDDGRDEVVMVVYFEDRETYQKNADDPRMHEMYVQYRALLDADPEWTDGEWEVQDS